MSDYTPVKGDRVRVVLEGEVNYVEPSVGSYFDLDTGDTTTIYPRSAATKSVEKLDPAVEVFKPGDVVRAKSYGDVFTLGKEGYIAHLSGNFLKYGTHTRAAWFNSENCEKVR